VWKTFVLSAHRRLPKSVVLGGDNPDQIEVKGTGQVASNAADQCMLAIDIDT